jgi:hypothetical protein
VRFADHPGITDDKSASRFGDMEDASINAHYTYSGQDRQLYPPESSYWSGAASNKAAGLRSSGARTMRINSP